MSAEPGQIAFTVMPWGASSRASAWVNPITPNLEAQYAARRAIADLAAVRRHVDDPPARPARHHEPGDRLAAEVRPGEVGLQDHVPRLLGEVDHRDAVGAGRGGGIVDEDVDPPEGPVRQRDRGADLIGRAHVDQRRHRAAAGAPDLVGHRLEPAPARPRLRGHDADPRGRQIRQHQVRALRGQPSRDGATEPMLAARRPSPWPPCPRAAPCPDPSSALKGAMIPCAPCGTLPPHGEEAR